jgi:hypothetical protein
MVVSLLLKNLASMAQMSKSISSKREKFTMDSSLFDDGLIVALT